LLIRCFSSIPISIILFFNNQELNKTIDTNYVKDILSILAHEIQVLDESNSRDKIKDDDETHCYIVHNVEHTKNIITLDDLAKAIPISDSIKLRNNILSDKQAYCFKINKEPNKIISEPFYPPDWKPPTEKSTK